MDLIIAIFHTGKAVIIVHDTHGGGGHESLTNPGWASPSGGGGGGGTWINHDSYSQGLNTGGGDATYAGTDQYSAGAGSGVSWGNGGGAPATHHWTRRSSSNDPHWIAYRAYIPDTDDGK